MRTKNIIELNTKGRFLKLISTNALFRIRIAKKYPGDDRNLHCSTALFELCKYVEGLPMEHVVFKKFDSMDEDQMEDFNRMLSHYGFCRDDEEVNPEKFINEV